MGMHVAIGVGGEERALRRVVIVVARVVLPTVEVWVMGISLLE